MLRTRISRNISNSETERGTETAIFFSSFFSNGFSGCDIESHLPQTLLCSSLMGQQSSKSLYTSGAALLLKSPFNEIALGSSIAVG